MHTNKHEFRKTTLAQPKARSKNPKKNLSRFTTADTEDTEKVKKQNPKPTTETRRKPQTRTKGKAAIKQTTEDTKEHEEDRNRSLLQRPQRKCSFRNMRLERCYGVTVRVR